VTQLIGNKLTIAIEYEVTSQAPLMGHGRLWFEGQPLGSLEDLIYLDGYLLGCLEDLVKKPRLTQRYQHMDEQGLFLQLDGDLSSYDEEDSKDFSEQARPYFVTCGTLFDCYLVFSYRLDDVRGSIMWRLEGDIDDLPFNDLKQASRADHFATFEYAQLLTLISEFRTGLSQAGSR